MYGLWPVRFFLKKLGERPVCGAVEVGDLKRALSMSDSYFRSGAEKSGSLLDEEGLMPSVVKMRSEKPPIG